MSEPDNWVICAGLTADHPPTFVGLRATKADALALADTLAAARYPGVVIERQSYGDDVNYKHPASYGGDNYFIQVFQPYKSLETSALKLFAYSAKRELDNKNSPANRENGKRGSV